MRRLRAHAEAVAVRLARRLPAGLSHIEVSLLSPQASAHVHARFLQDPTPTDVITFDHGEILVCPAVAERQRHAEGLSLQDEVLIYIIHGLLHLCGEDDTTARGFNQMRVAQARLLREVRSTHP